MSTIASPRPSFNSSRRTSTSTDTANTHAPPVDRGSLRRNRTALRDYYGLQASAKASNEPSPAPPLSAEHESELDAPNFNPENYVSSLLSKEGLEGVLKVEAGLVSEIRTLDGEKKALVYDNYSKLIAATDTIARMREKMDPLTPTTSTLAPAIGHIAETAAALRTSDGGKASSNDSDIQRRQQERETAKWVLDAPRRLQALIDDRRKEEADREWREIARLLDKWKGVNGVEDVRSRCLEALNSGNG